MAKKVTVEDEAPEQPTVKRALTMPVRDVAFGKPSGNWENDPTALKAFWACCKAGWCEGARAACWLATQLAAHEPPRAADGLLPRFEVDQKPINAEGRLLFPLLDSQIYYQIAKNVRASYVKDRLDVFRKNSRSLRTFRSPFPIPLPAAQFPLVLDAAGLPCMQIRLWDPNNGEPTQTTFTVRLEHGKDFEWHKEVLTRCVAGELKHGAASIKRGKRGDLMMVVPVHIPVDPIKKTIKNALLVSTNPGALLTVQIEGKRRGKPLILNEDWLLMKIQRHTLFRQRFSEDMRHEVRRNKQFKRNHYRALRARCESHEDRVKDRLHKVTRSVADFAQRNRCAVVVYDDRDRSYFHRLDEAKKPLLDERGRVREWPFPWATMQSLLADKLKEFAIQLVAREAVEGDETKSEKRGK